MKNNETIRELLSGCRTAARALNIILGVDFQRSFDAATIKGRYTVNQVIKTAAAAGHSPEDIILLTNDPNYIFNYEYRIATLNHYGRVNIDYKTPSFSDYGTRARVDHYFTKRDFESARKSDTATTYIIMQKPEDRNQPKSIYANKATDSNSRYKYLSRFCGLSDGRGHSWEFHRINLQRTDGSAEQFEYEARHASNDLQTIIDKSGYLLEDRRENLKRRAEALRAERAAEAYKETDNRTQIEALREKAEALKESVLKELANAKTGEEITEIGRKIWNYKGLGGIFSDIERIEKRDAAKEYRSVSDFERAYNNIAENIANF